MKNLRGEFLFGYFTLDGFLKVSPLQKVKPFLNTARKPDSVRRLADLSAYVKKKNVKFPISNFQRPMKNLRGEFLFGYFTLNILHWTFYIGYFTLDILH